MINEKLEAITDYVNVEKNGQKQKCNNLIYIIIQVKTRGKYRPISLRWYMRGKLEYWYDNNILSI